MIPIKTFSATVVITTKNRREELRRALASALRQEPSVEVLVIDDGSTDGTEEMVRREFPHLRLERAEQSVGYIVQRNRAAQLATAPIIFSIDDDAEFSTPHTVAQTLRDFDHPRIGAVAIPFVDTRKGNGRVVRQKAPDAGGRYITDCYIGTAHAVRRDVFLALGGYRAHFVHQGEEGDFCLRMLNVGYMTRLGTADPILHHESEMRDLTRMDFYGRRNDVLFAWHNVPLLVLLPYLGIIIFRGLIFGVQLKRPRNMLRGIVAGCRDIFRFIRRRAPVSMQCYCLHRRLRKHRVILFDQVERHLNSSHLAIKPSWWKTV